MPHTTQAYPFEWKVHAFAQRLSAQLAGGQGYDSFLMVLNAQGSVQTLFFKCPEDSWHQVRERLDQAGTAYLFYDPFGAPEYSWLSWRQIDRSTMERLLGDQLQDTDFIKLEHAGSRAPDLERPDEFPVSWGVMF